MYITLSIELQLKMSFGSFALNSTVQTPAFFDLLHQAHGRKHLWTIRKTDEQHWCHLTDCHLYIQLLIVVSNNMIILVKNMETIMLLYPH